MSLGDVIFSAKLDTKQFDRQVADIEKKKIKSPFGKFKEDITFFTAGFKASAQKMKEAQKEVLGYSKVYDDLVKKGEEFKASMDSMISGPTLSQQEEWQKLSAQINQAKSDMQEAQKYLRKAERGFNARNLFGKAFGRLKEFGARVLQTAKGFVGLGKSAKGAGTAITHGMGQGIRRMLGMVGAGALLYKTFQYVREGMNNLIAYDKNTANSVNTLKNSLTALKNALASAFAPILNVIAPILSKFIGMLTAAANAVASFLSALTGKKFAVVASGAADGLDGIGGSASGANDSAKELQRTLMGFDKINKLDSNSGGGSGGGGGGGAGGGGGFDLVPVGDEANKWAEQFKKSWEDADFEWLGELLAEKINSALEKIPWGKINTVLEKVAKSIGTFLNGFVKNLDWGLLGETIGEGVKSALNFLNTFLETVDWESVGQAIVKFFAGIDWVGIFKASARLLGNIADAIFGIFEGAIKEARKQLDEWIKSDKIWSDLFEIGKTTVDIAIKILGDGAKLLKDFFGVVYDIAINLIGSGLKKLKDWLFGTGKDSADVSLIPKFTLPSGIKDVAGLLFSISPTGNTIGFIAKLTSFIKGFDSNVISDMIARFTGKENGLSTDDKTLGGMIAKFTQRENGLSKDEKSLNMKANITSRKNSLSKKEKTLTGFKATITSINISQKALNKVNKGLSVKAAYKAGGGIYKNGRWSPIQRYDSGGLPNGSQLFWARENGPELVGTLGGHTAVMNNDQIVASVSSGVAKAIAGIRFKMTAPKLANTSSQTARIQEKESDNKEMVDILMQILKAINSQETNVYLDGEEIKNNVVRRINNHTRATGKLEIVM